ncbi:MAG: alpha/beta fold hydrolase [Solirubrobacteraceae bacterium]|nr:alpha/beta fold hydrolase [Solirubrobacteraceae bacterium]
MSTHQQGILGLGKTFDPRRTLGERRQAVVNLYDFLLGGGIAADERTPSVLVDAPLSKGSIRRYVAADGVEQHGAPVLLVPPLGAPPTCFDLRPGCSVAGHLVASGRPTYLLDYGAFGFSDRELGIEHLVGDIIPSAVRAVSADAGGTPVQLVGWSMGGLLALLTVAAFGELPVAAVAMVASPFDVSRHPLVWPFRALGRLTGGRVVGTATRAMGGLPAVLVGPAFKLASFPTYVKKPLTLYAHRDDRDFLAHIEAVDLLMNGMFAYPGRAALQVYLRLLQRNELASGRIAGPTRDVDLADVRVPVMNIAGATDTLVPSAVAHGLGELVPNAAEVRLEVAPGGHLGVLTGRSAAASSWLLIDDFFDAHQELAAAG